MTVPSLERYSTDGMVNKSINLIAEAFATDFTDSTDEENGLYPGILSNLCHL